MEYIKLNKKPYWVGFAKNNHHHYFAQKIKRATNNYQLECWRPYGDIIDKVYEKHVDGILHKVFPSKKKYYYGFGTFMYSELLLKEILTEQKKNNLLIILHDGHSRFATWLLIKLKNLSIPIIYIQRSYSFSRYRYKIRN